MIDFADLMGSTRDFFNRGVEGANALTVLRQSDTVNSGGELSSSAWAIITAALAGHIQPQEGPFRAIAGASQLVQDWMLFMTPDWDASGNPIVQTNDLIVDGIATLTPSTALGYTVTPLGSSVYRVQYVQNFVNDLWQVRMKVGQAARS